MTKTMKTGLKRGRRNRNVNLQCFPYTRCSLSFALKYLPSNVADQSVAAAAAQNAMRNVEPLSVNDRVLSCVAE